MTDDHDAYRFTWGDTVRVREDAPPEFRRGEVASVCGFRRTASGTLVYTVEYVDGSDQEIEEAHLDSED